MRPFSLSKNKKATTPISGGVASGISSKVVKNDFKGILWYWKIYAKYIPTMALPITVNIDKSIEL